MTSFPITNLQDGSYESLSADTSGTFIVASYDSATGTLSLTGEDTLENYQQVESTFHAADSEPESPAQ